jgi:predicted ATPase
MRLQRVQIPNFRVLKDIDITFEEYHTPQIFPLASQNGGGKSTLLQLVFTLLTCCNGNDENKLVENLVQNYMLTNTVTSYENILSTMIHSDSNDNIRLDFTFYTNASLFEKFLTEVDENKMSEFAEYGISGYHEWLGFLEFDSKAIAKALHDLRLDKREIERMVETESFPFPASEILNLSKESINIISNFTSSDKALIALDKYIDDKRKKLVDLDIDCKELLCILSKINTSLASQGIKTIYCKDNLNLICQVTSDKSELNTSDLLDRISNSVFMAAPSSQVFIFLSSEEVSSLFTEASEYYKILKERQKTISNLFLHEFSMVKILTDAFKKAFDSDKAQAIKNGGKYGNEFELLFNSLKDFLNGKTIQPSEDMSKIIVKQKSVNNQEIELSPADLSHGELRRLSFYAWLKTNKINNSIVLVDEIEIGLHPDWQYQIVRDLEEWEPSNQYILATHSYEICSALSPAHVKEIEPKLLKTEAKMAQ